MSVLLVKLLMLSVTGAHVLVSDTEYFKFDSISNCVLGISNLRKYSKNTIVLYKADNISLNLFQEKILSLIVTEKLPYIVTNNLNEIHKPYKYYAPNILVVIYHKACDNLDILIEKDTKYLVVVDEYLFETNCNGIFIKTLSKFSNYDVIFVTRDKVYDKYNIFTSIPTWNEEHCATDKLGKLNIKEVDVCVNGSLEYQEDKIIFPPKIVKNLKLCPFKVGMATLFPYSVIANKEKLQTLDSLKEQNIFGSDLEIMKIIAYNFNSTLELFYINRSEENALLQKEFVEYLLNGTLDACAGGLYNIYGDVVAYSGIYTRQAIIWIYTVERKPRSWQTLLAKTEGLYIFLIFQACYSLVWKMLCHFYGESVPLSDIMLYSLGALVGTTSLPDTRFLKQKILNVSYLILCLHLSSYVSTQMYYYLTVENPPQTINTLDELAISDRKPYLVPTKKFFLNNEKYISFANTSRDCTDFIDCERSVIKYRGSTIILDGLLYPLQSSTAVKDESRVMRVYEDILIIYHEMIMRKNSPMVDKFHNMVQRLFEAGICDKLYNEAIGVTIVDRAKIAVKNVLTNSYSCTTGCKITWLQLAGSFYLWMIGCGLSVCCFIIEILRKKQI